MSYSIIEEDEGLVFQFQGIVPFGEIMEASRDWYYRTDLDRFNYHIWDFGNVDRLDMDDFSAKTVAMMDSSSFRLINETKLALIGTGNDIKSIFEEYISSLETDKIVAKVIDNETDARKWIA